MPLRAAFVIVVVAALSLACRPVERLAAAPLVEDGFYSLSIARNLALGRGLTTDSAGGEFTSGFQPLFTFICSIVYLAVADQLEALRLVFLLSTCVFAASAWSYACLARNLAVKLKYRNVSFAFWSTALLYVSSNTLRMQHHNGLETGFYLLMLSLFLHLALQQASAVMRGTVLGLLCLTRIDAIPLAAIYIGLTLLFGHHTSTVRLRQSAVLAGTTFLIVLPWLSYSYILTGSIVPSSGRQSMAFSLDQSRFIAARAALGQILAGFLDIAYLDNRYPEATRTIKLLLLGISGLALWRGVRCSSVTVIEASKACSFLLTTHLLFCCYLVGWYTLNSSAHWFYPRYFTPLAPFAVLIIVLGVEKIGEWIRSLQNIINPRLRALLKPVSLNIGVVLLLLSPLRSTYLHHQGSLGAKTPLGEQLELVEKNVPDGDRVGAFQSGTLGYFRANVLNLDGKINHVALKHLGSRDAFKAYLTSAGVRWLCDVDFIIRSYMDDAAMSHWRKVGSLYSDVFDGEFVLYARR